MSSLLDDKVDSDFLEDLNDWPSDVCDRPWLVSEVDEDALAGGDSSDVELLPQSCPEPEDKESWYGTSIGAEAKKKGFSRITGLQASVNPVIRTGDVGDDTRSMCSEERIDLLREEKGRARLSAGFLRLLTVAGDAVPGSCMAARS